MLERWQLQLRCATLGSPVASPVWPESSPEKRTKTALAPLLLGAIIFSSELRFLQTLYRWKVDVESFPKIYCMTYFEYQRPPKLLSKIGSEKGTCVKTEEDSVEGIRMPHGTCAGPCRAVSDGPARGVHAFL